MRFKNKDSKRSEKQQVAERREEVLAKGRKFRYPLQYAKHKLILFSIAIAVVMTAVFIFVGWGLLYKAQNTGDVIYRISRVIPVAVADVDNEKVMFADYLMFYRSSIKAVEKQSGSFGDDEDAENLRKSYKRAALDEAEKLTFASKLARELNINVSREEIDEEFLRHRNVGGTERSEESFLKVVSDNFGLSKNEYERMLKLQLIKSKVSEEIDNKAKTTVEKIEKMIAEGKGMGEIRDSLGADIVYEETGGLVSSKNIDGGRSDVAFSLKAREISQKYISFLL